MSMDTRDKIIKAAGDLFYASSFADVGVQAICDHADVKKGSFYHFFRSKNELAVAVIEAVNEDFVKTTFEPAFHDDIPPLERFDRLVDVIAEGHHTIKRAGGHVLGCPFGNMAIELSARDHDIQSTLEGVFSQMKTTFAKTLKEAQENGMVGDINIDSSADAIVVFFQGAALLAKTRNDPDLIKKISPLLKNFFV